MKTSNLAERTAIRLPSDQRELLERVAQASGLKPSQIVRAALAQTLPVWDRSGVRLNAERTFKRKPCLPPSGN